MKCSKCQANNLRSAQTCSNCGAPLGAAADAGKTVQFKPRAGGGIEFRVRRSNLGGVAQAEYTLSRSHTVIGRTEGDWTCPDDARLSRKHARLLLEGNRLFLEDLKSTNGTYLRLPSRYKLSPGDNVLIGNELFRVNVAGGSLAGAETEGTLYFGEGVPTSDLTLMDPRGEIVQEIVLKKERTVVGRGKADLSFPQDPVLAEQHAVFVREQRGLYLEDLGSARGVFRRILERVELREGDKFLLGEQVLHVYASG